MSEQYEFPIDDAIAAAVFKEIYRTLEVAQRENKPMLRAPSNPPTLEQLQTVAGVLDQAAARWSKSYAATRDDATRDYWRKQINAVRAVATYLRGWR